jgi:hypothetical protein
MYKYIGFNMRIGRLFGGLSLIRAIGFELEENGTVLALRDPSGKPWEILPPGVKVMLNTRLEELRNHEQARKPNPNTDPNTNPDPNPNLIITLTLNLNLTLT